MSSTFGQNFRITTFGESHGGAVGVVVDGCPAGVPIALEDIQHFLSRRRPGQSALASPRDEKDLVECLSGLQNGVSLGSPISLIVRNKDAKKEHYSDMAQVYRPSHADYTTTAKYGVRAASGGGRASARETIGRVAGAAVAEALLLREFPELRVTAWVDKVHKTEATVPDLTAPHRDTLDQHPLRCPDEPSRDAMERVILNAKKKGDSVGGTITCAVTGCPPGWGEPVFDKLEAKLAQAMMSLPASKGFEVGMGFGATELYGSEHNDAFMMKDGAVSTETNRSGGIQGGISNGETLWFRVAFKPVATIFKDQRSVNEKGEDVVFKPKAGRHDPCVLPRAVPMVEAMTSLVLADMMLRQKQQVNLQEISNS